MSVCMCNEPISLEAKQLILVWIMKVNGPKNQADFIEVLVYPRQVLRIVS